MISRIYNLWTIIGGSLWFTPAVICLVYVLALSGILAFENTALTGAIEEWGIFFQGSIEEARSVIALLLSAMITMTTLAVSITVVVLSLAASQLGPRLIKSFMADRRTQGFIGVCFALTGILHDSSLATPPPRLTITVVFLACFISLFVLLAFTNHVANSSIADQVIERVSRELFAAISRLADPGENATSPSTRGAFPHDFEPRAASLSLPKHGYVQNIDYKHLLGIAKKHDLRIRVLFKAGYYITPGEDGLRAYPPENLTPELREKLLNAVIVGKRRTPTQDIEYSMRHLTEIALRALSPGMNDSYTAIAVINRLSAAIAHIFRKHVPTYDYCDDDGVLRVSGASLSEADAISDAFSPIRQSAQANPLVLDHLLKKIQVLLKLATTARQREGLQHELDRIEEAIRINFPGTGEGDDLLEDHREAETILNPRR